MNDGSVFIYSGKNGETKISARFADDDVWLTQQQLAEIYETSQQNISLHLKTIYEDEELLKEATHKDFLSVQNAVHEHTAAEIVYDRVDNEKPIVGMTNFKGEYITKDDVKIAKNSLTEKELLKFTGQNQRIVR